MRPPRFRLRMLMVAVAIVEIAIGLAGRSLEFVRLAEGYNSVACQGVDETPEQIRARSLWDRYNARVCRKHRIATCTSFLPVMPDTTQPE